MTFSGSKGLAFHKNDILHVLNAVDDNWWSAALVVDGNEDQNERGIIPSKMRVEKKERVKQKRVNFNGGSKSRVSFLDEQFEKLLFFSSTKIFSLRFQTNTIERDKKKKKKSTGFFSRTTDKSDGQSGEDSEFESENFGPIASYTPISQHESKFSLFFSNLFKSIFFFSQLFSTDRYSRSVQRLDQRSITGWTTWSIRQLCSAFVIVVFFFFVFILNVLLDVFRYESTETWQWNRWTWISFRCIERTNGTRYSQSDVYRSRRI